MQQHPRPSSPGTDAGIDEDLIAKLVDLFYATVRQDALIGPVFEARVEDWDAHLTKLMAFWSSVVLKAGATAAVRCRCTLPSTRFPATILLGGDRLLKRLAMCVRPAAAALFLDRSQRIAELLQLGISLHRGDGVAFESPRRVPRPA